MRHIKVELSKIKSADELVGFIKVLGEQIPNNPSQSGPIMDTHNHIKSHIIDNMSNNFVVPLLNGLLVKIGKNIIGVGARPTAADVFAALDAVNNSSDSLPPNEHQGISPPSRIDNIRYISDLWDWYDRKPLGGSLEELGDWLGGAPQAPEVELP